jgi:DivIVA domain-containing protein
MPTETHQPSLTADDVVLKSFRATKWREGYDQVEVDDFLDQVAMALREQEQVITHLVARVAELESGLGQG